MFRTMYKLTKQFQDQPGPRNVADRLRIKIEKFRQHQPLLNVICNPGIRDRHWQQVRARTAPIATRKRGLPDLLLLFTIIPIVSISLLYLFGPPCPLLCFRFHWPQSPRLVRLFPLNAVKILSYFRPVFFSPSLPYSSYHIQAAGLGPWARA